MKKFIYKSLLFTIPFLFLHVLNTFYYNQKEGDLTRIGYLYSNPSPKTKISNQFASQKEYTLISEINLDTKSKFDVLTIGDSFSEQGRLGYNNFLATKGVSVLHTDRFLSENPIQTLIELGNSDFFDTVQIDYVILQSIERNFVQRTEKLDYSKSLSVDILKNKIRRHTTITPKQNLNFFSKSTLNIPLINLQYLYNTKPKNSKTYKVKTTNKNLFTGNTNSLLFYEQDVNSIDYKNDALKIANSNSELNRINDLLSKKKIKLIVLISPDKFDLYYPYITNKDYFKKPLFFDYYNNLPKEYASVNSFGILSDLIATNKDVYYYDDTHWSPKGASIIASEINEIIKKEDQTHNNDIK